MDANIKRALLYIAICLNLFAIYMGAAVYADQFALHPWYLSIFVPDCPLYVFLALLIILGIVRNDIFSFIVSVGMVKYGLWTVFVLFFHSGYYFAPGLFAISVVFVLGHIGMAIEGLALLPKKRLGALALALAICWFLANDFSDYFLGTVPLMPPGGLDIVCNITIASSIILPIAIFALAGRIRKNLLVAWLRGILFNEG